MGEEAYSNMFKSLESFTEKTKTWSPERKHRAEETVRVFDTTFADEKYIQRRESLTLNK